MLPNALRNSIKPRLASKMRCSVVGDGESTNRIFNLVDRVIEPIEGRRVCIDDAVRDFVEELVRRD